MANSQKQKRVDKASSQESEQLRKLDSLVQSLFKDLKLEPKELSELKELLSLSSQLSKDTLKGKVPKEQHQEVQSWLDWSKDLLSEYGPMLKEAAKVLPEVLALL